MQLTAEDRKNRERLVEVLEETIFALADAEREASEVNTKGTGWLSDYDTDARNAAIALENVGPYVDQILTQLEAVRKPLEEKQQ